MAGEVPEIYFCQSLTDLTGFQEASIRRGSSLRVELQVLKTNCIIRSVQVFACVCVCVLIIVSVITRSVCRRQPIFHT